MPIRRSSPRSDAPGSFRACVFLAAVLLMAGAVSADEEYAVPDVRELVEQGTILPLDQVIRRVRSLHPGRIIEARLRHEARHGGYVYEVEVVGADGVVWEMEFVAGNGELIKSKVDGD